MSRRNDVRSARRVQVQFWKPGDTHAYSGHTTNVSATGMFIATNRPFPVGTRLRVEVTGSERAFAVEGIVTHARKHPPELARLHQSGMGIRLLPVGDLIGELIPSARGKQPPPSRPVQAQRAAAPRPEPSCDRSAPPLRAPLDSSRPLPSASGSSRAAGAPSRPAGLRRRGLRESVLAGGTYSVRFNTPLEFLQTYDRDLRIGGLFICTRFPARLQEIVEVEVLPPEDGAQPVRARARVVQRFEPRTSGEPMPASNLLPGMGLELLDPAGLLERLRSVAERLRGQQLAAAPPPSIASRAQFV